MATRFKAPIFTFENILDKAGIILKIKDESKLAESKFKMEDLVANVVEETSTFKDESLDELYKQLDQAVNNEDYELAAKLRDEISKREKK